MPRLRIPWWTRLVIAPALLVAVLWAVDWRAVIQRVSGADVSWLLLALATAVCANATSAWRWRSLVRWLGKRVSLAWAETTYFKAVAINALLPGAVVGGDVFRAMSLQRQGQPALESGLSVLIDRVSGLWMLIVLGGFAAAWGVAHDAGSGWLSSLGMPLLSSAAFVFATLALLIAPAVGLLIGRHLIERPGADANWPARLIGLAHRPHTGVQYGWQVLGSTIVQALSVATLACSGRALGLDEPFWVYAVAAVPTFLMATLPVSFGGWGTREAAAALALGAFGVPTPAAVAISMLYGLFALAQAMVGAGLLLASRREQATR